MPSPNAIRTVACFEALKGVVVLLAATGLLSLIHEDLHALAARLVEHAHLNPASKYPRIFVDAAAHLQDSRLVLLALGAAAYSLVRLAEAYGLFHRRAWAEVLAAVSGAIYLPFEIIELIRRPGWLEWATFALNLVIVGVMIHALLQRRRSGAGGGATRAGSFTSAGGTIVVNEAMPRSTMDIERFMQGYQAAWEQRDDTLFVSLFAEDGEYHNTPFAVQRGRAQLAAYWQRVKLQQDVQLRYDVLSTSARGGIAHWHVTYQVASEELFSIWAQSTGTNLVARQPGDPLPRMVLDGVLQAEFDDQRCRRARIWWHSLPLPA